MRQRNEGQEGAALLADDLITNRDRILELWRQRVIGDPDIPIANKLPEPLLTDHIPSFLDEIIDGLNQSKPNDSQGEHAKGHGDRIGQGKTSKDHARTRTWQGYALPEALAELAHLRAVICYVCFQDKPTMLPFLLVNSAIDTAMALVAEEIALCRSEEAVARRATDERMRLLLENVKDYGIFTTDADGRIKDWSQGAERITGFAESDIIGEDSRIFFTPEDRDASVPEEEMAKAAVHGRAEDVRWHMRKDQTRFWAAGFTTALRSEDGELRGFSKIFRDETDRKRAEEERENLLAELQRLDQMKDVFLATLSHELRTPLGVISGYVELLQDGYSQDDPILFKEALAAIERNVNVQIQIVSDLLDISRIITGKLAIEMRPLELLPVIEASLATVRSLAKAKQVDLRLTSDPFVGPIMGDPGRIQQVIWNLLTNAIKFSPEDSAVDVIVRRADNDVEIRVIDAGRGINADLLPYVFDRFRQSEDPVNKKHGGLGLGLALVRQLVELHGGSAFASSEGEGKGATFTVRLPAMRH